MSESTGWTVERRQRQAEAIRRWKPWLLSTGPQTPEGKARSALNATKHGGRGALMRRLGGLLQGLGR